MEAFINTVSVPLSGIVSYTKLNVREKPTVEAVSVPLSGIVSYTICHMIHVDFIP